MPKIRARQAVRQNQRCPTDIRQRGRKLQVVRARVCHDPTPVSIAVITKGNGHEHFFFRAQFA
jgi:hypothetical protein